MKKIISISVSMILIVAGLLMFPSQKTDQGIILKDGTENMQNESTNFTNHIEFNQEEIQLQKEAVQYKITFHQNDVITVSTNMFVSYVDETITSVYCLLTDGKEPLLEPRLLWYVPDRKYSLVTPKIRLSVGRLWFINLLNEKQGRIRFGSAYNESKHYDVKDGDTWYLTLAVPASYEKSGYSVILQSLHNSMQASQLIRHHSVDLFSVSYNQFSGKYYAIKLLFLGGCSVCDVNKEITIRNGTIVCLYAGGHRKGSMQVTFPSGEEKQFNQKGFMKFSYLGNASGTWKFAVQGWSIYFRMQVVLMYIDIDPHVASD